jgi:D-alanyl-D-alanine carboxypeptidase
MVAIRYFAFVCIAGSLAAASFAGGTEAAPSDPPTLPPPSLFAQSAAATLEQRFPDPNISFLLLDAHTGAVIASRWTDPEKPIPLGSLVKPFTALAYGEQHEFQYPTHTRVAEPPRVAGSPADTVA